MISYTAYKPLTVNTLWAYRNLILLLLYMYVDLEAFKLRQMSFMYDSCVFSSGRSQSERDNHVIINNVQHSEYYKIKTKMMMIVICATE